MLGIEVFTHRFNRHFLIMAVGDAVLHAEVGNVVPFSFLYEQFQVALGVESVESTRRITQTINDMGLKAVGVVNNRSHPISLFKAVGIQFGLVFALDGRHARPFGLNHGKGQTITAEQHIIAEALALGIRHTFNLDLYASL